MSSLTTKDGAALVKGRPAEGKGTEMSVYLEFVRNTYGGGKRRLVGQKADIPEAEATLLVAMGKAVPAKKGEAEPRKTDPEKPAEAPKKRGRKPKGKGA